MLAVTLNLKLSRLLFILLVARFFQPQPDLVVMLRDAQDRPLAGIAVQVLSTASGPPLASATTDVQGTVTLSGLAVERVFVLVRGQLPDGTKLRLPGQDAAGIAVLLGPPPTRLDLRVAADGLVLPDPAALDETAASTSFPVEPAGRPIIFPTVSVPPYAPADAHAAHPIRPLPAPSPPTGAALAAPSLPATSSWLGWALVGSALLAGVLVLRALWRRRT